MYEMNSIKWIDINTNQKYINKPINSKNFTSQSTTSLAQPNKPDYQPRKGKSCQIDSPQQKPKIQLKLNNKMLDYFMYNLKAHFKQNIKEQQSLIKARQKQKSQEKQKRCSSASLSHFMDSKKMSSEMMDIRKKAIVEPYMPVFENKKLSILKRTKQQKRSHIRNRSQHYLESKLSPVVTTVQEPLSTLQKYEHNNMMQTQDFYLKTQNKPKISESMNHLSIDSNNQTKTFYQEEFVIPQQYGTKSQKKKQAKSVFSAIRVSRIDLKPIHSVSHQVDQMRALNSWVKVNPGIKKNTVNNRRRSQMQKNKQKNQADELNIILRSIKQK